MSKAPDYLKESAGLVEITLASPAKLHGIMCDRVKMREPLARDIENMESLGATAAAQEIAMFANLCEANPEDIRGMSLRNYKRLQDGFRLFTA